MASFDMLRRDGAAALHDGDLSERRGERRVGRKTFFDHGAELLDEFHVRTLVVTADVVDLAAHALL